MAIQYAVRQIVIYTYIRNNDVIPREVLGYELFYIYRLKEWH